MGDYKISKRGTWDVKRNTSTLAITLPFNPLRWEVPYDATNRYYDPNFHGGPAYVTSYPVVTEVGWQQLTCVVRQCRRNRLLWASIIKQIRVSVTTINFPNYYRRS